MEERLRYLFQQYLGNNCTRPELEEFLNLIRRAGNEPALRQLIRQVYGELKKDAAFQTYVDENGRLVLTGNDIAFPAELKENTKPLRVVAKLLVAAMAILIAGSVWLLAGTGKRNVSYSPIASLTRKGTDRSEQKFIVLSDSTKVWLNAASTLEFPDQFEAGKREVYLSGEAFFDVKHADKIPFIIRTGNVSTTVLGTAFNIKAYPGQKNITVSVSRGKVRVSRKDGWETTLTVGQQVKVEELNKTATEKAVSVNDVAAWQQGDIVFDDESLADIIADMERIYNVEIAVRKTGLEQLKISTSFRKEIGVEQALQVLCRLTECELKRTNGIYTIH